MEAIVRAFGLMSDLKLIVAGDGPQASRLRELAGPNVSLVGFMSDEELRRLMATARAFIFAAEEDFGIIPVEAMSEGTPVLALTRGGARETVTASLVRRTGMFFPHPTPEDIAACVRAFIDEQNTFLPDNCRAQASRFSPERFRAEFTAFIDETMENSGWKAEVITSRKSALQAKTR
jgi:glycosyltransferase involved in cell wall biosynthesis